MAIKRMDNVGIVVDDLGETIDFFRELGLELEGRPRSKENGQILTRLSSRIRHSGSNGTENSLKVCYWLGRVAFRAKISHRDK
jgi:catechol 2,3-dioxygenase-like lactoylglutathione lyase family enzyme